MEDKVGRPGRNINVYEPGKPHTHCTYCMDEIIGILHMMIPVQFPETVPYFGYIAVCESCFFEWYEEMTPVEEALEPEDGDEWKRGK